MSVTFPFWYAVYSGWGFDGTPYAKGRYTVRKNYVILADIKIYLNKVKFSSRNTINVTYKVI